MTKLKIKEWDDAINPTNSMKVLVHTDRLRRQLNGENLPPVLLEWDLTNKCNYKCHYCISDYQNKKYPHHYPEDKVMETAEKIVDWGIKAVVFAGGGEPTIHPKFKEVTEYLYSKGVKISLITNGSCLTPEKYDTKRVKFEFIGISIDAGNKKVFGRKHRVKELLFETVIDNIKILVESGIAKKVTYKYLIGYEDVQDNFDSFLAAVNRAIYLNVTEFYARVVWDQKLSEEQYEDIWNNIPGIAEWAIGHFKKKSEVKCYIGIHRFQNKKNKVQYPCITTPLIGVLGADANFHLCCDRRGEVVGEFGDDPSKSWLSKEHRDLIEKIDVSKCPRCRYSKYNEIMHKTIIEEKLLEDFI